jgi:hypothetical protein
MLKLSDMLNTLMDPVVVTNPTAVKAAGATTPTNP